MRQMRTLLDRLGIDLPIVLAPMAGSHSVELTAAVSNAGGLGSHPCAMLTPAQVIEQSAQIRKLTNHSFNLNFFCHQPQSVDDNTRAAWRRRLSPYYGELGIDESGVAAAPQRKPFDDAMCDALVSVAPRVASFHFGMPRADLVARVKKAGCTILCAATTVAEARMVVAQGADVVIAQGVEAGGHRGVFLDLDMSRQVGTFSLVPQVADAVDVPVIAAGGISDPRGVAAALTLGADAVQVGTAFLLTPEARISPQHRAALKSTRDDATVLTNVFTGRPARGIVNRLISEVGPLSADAPAFPEAAGAIAPLRAQAEAGGSGDFSPLWSGQSAALAREMGAADLTRMLARDGLALLRENAAAIQKD